MRFDKARVVAALLVVGGLTLVPARQLPSMTVDTSNESMSGDGPLAPVDADDPMAGQTLLLAFSAERPFTFAQWQAIADLGGRVGELPGVAGLFYPLAAGDAWLLPLLRRVSPEGATRLGSLFRLLRSEDGRHLGLLVLLAPEAASGSERSRLLADLQTLLSTPPVPESQCRLVGLPVVDEAVGEMIRRDQRLLLPLSAGMIGVMLLWLYRDLPGLLAPATTTGLAIVWTLGIYAWRVRQLNVVTSLLAPVVMILSLSTSIHVYEAFRTARRAGETAPSAANRAFGRVWRPCLFSALTTAAGLGSLALSSIPAVRLFGCYAALGVLLAFLFGIGVTPMLLSLSSCDRVTPPRRHPAWLTKALKTCYRLGCYRHRRVTLSLGGLSLVAMIGLGHLRSNTNLIDFLRQDSALVQSCRYVDRHLMGVNALACRISPAVGGAEPRPLERRPFLDALRKLDGVNGILPGDLHGRATGDAVGVRDSARPPDARSWTLTLRVRAIGSHAARRLIREVRTLAARHLGAGTTIDFAGDFYRIVTESDGLVWELLQSFALALAVIMLLIGLQLRSVSATVMAMVPNLLAVLWVFGTMGWLGIDLSTGTAMIACVVLGLAVDHTIHYLCHLRATRHRHALGAIRATTLEVGPALAVSTLILAAGFGVGAAGSFKPTLYFSLFTALAMLAALLCNLIAIPVMFRFHPPVGKLCEPRTGRRRYTLPVTPSEEVQGS